MRVLMFTGNMDAKFSVGEILEKTLLPFIESRFADGYRFHQDNDPKHTSHLAQDFRLITESTGGQPQQRALTSIPLSYCGTN